MLQTNPDSQSASCPPPFHPPPHPGPTGGNKKISRRLKVCFWNSGKNMSTFYDGTIARTQPLINEFCRKYELITQPLRIAWNVKPTCGLDQWKNM